MLQQKCFHTAAPSAKHQNRHHRYSAHPVCLTSSFTTRTILQATTSPIPCHWVVCLPSSFPWFSLTEPSWQWTVYHIISAKCLLRIQYIAKQRLQHLPGFSERVRLSKPTVSLAEATASYNQPPLLTEICAHMCFLRFLKICSGTPSLPWKMNVFFLSSPF